MKWLKLSDGHSLHEHEKSLFVELVQSGEKSSQGKLLCKIDVQISDNKHVLFVMHFKKILFFFVI